MSEVVIIGGGPAGAAMGAYLSRAGIKNVIFEQAVHPRPHVGESLVPSTTRVFHELGFLPELDHGPYVKKYGAAWHPPGKAQSVEIKFQALDLDAIDQDYSYHVDRAKFDLQLLKHAESLGSKVCQGVRVRRVLFEGDRATGVELDVAGQKLVRKARLVVDATGRNVLIGRQLGIKRPDPLFNQFVVHGWYRGVDRGKPETADYIHIHFLPVKRGWVWQIPIDEEITSIGVVAEKAVFKSSKKDVAGWFEKLACSAPDIAHAMRDARLVNELAVEADYSYSLDRLAGNGFVLLGDAARFVDPIFSSGVSVALYSAKFAAECVERAFETDDFSEKVFKPYEERLRKGTTIWYEFIRLYYKLLPIFTHFIKSEKYTKQIHQLLSGDVYDRDEVPVLDAMRQFIHDAETIEDHVFAPYIDPDIPLYGDAPVGEPANG